MKEGEIITYDFEVYADEKLIATSIEELAKENEIHDEEFTYGPAYIITGMEGPFPGIKTAIEQIEEGEESESIVEPKEAFGERKTRDIEQYRYKDIAYMASQQEKELERGVELEIQGRTGVVSLVTAARVRVDFNHIHAGKTITSKVKIVKVLKERDELIRAILEMHTGKGDDFDFSEEDGILIVKIPQIVSLDSEWAGMKLLVVSQLRRHSGIKNIRYVEEFFQKIEKADVDTDDDHAEGDAGDGVPEIDPADEGSDEGVEEIPAEEEVSEHEEPVDESDEPVITVGSSAAVAEPRED